MKLATSLIVIFMMLSSGCSVLLDRNDCDPDATRIDAKDNTFQVKAGEYYEQDITNLALDIFEDEWIIWFGQSADTHQMANNMCIIWEPYPFELEDGGETEEGLPRRFSGVTESVGKVRVWISEQREIGFTAFIHELVHVMLWRTTGEPDPDHEGDVYEGWTDRHNEFIGHVKSIIREASE